MNVMLRSSALRRGSAGDAVYKVLLIAACVATALAAFFPIYEWVTLYRTPESLPNAEKANLTASAGTAGTAAKDSAATTSTTVAGGAAAAAAATTTTAAGAAAPTTTVAPKPGAPAAPTTTVAPKPGARGQSVSPALAAIGR